MGLSVAHWIQPARWTHQMDPPDGQPAVFENVQACVASLAYKCQGGV